MRKKFVGNPSPGVILPPTNRETFLSFLYAFVFGLVCIAPWMELVNVIPPLFVLVSGLPYSGNAARIATGAAFGILWFALFSILWHRLERNFDLKRSALYTLRWIAFAVVIYIVVVVAHVLLDRFLLS